MRRSRLSLIVILSCITAIDACDGTDGRPAAAPVAGVVDSALPIDTLLRRFRATVADTPSALAGGAASREALVRELLAALARGDSARVAALALTKAEFAWLYYPHTRFARPPYELGPDLLWLHLSANHTKGLVRLQRRFGRRALRLESLRCPDAGRAEGPNLLSEGCRVRIAVADSAPRELRLFGSLLSHRGRYKFVSFANDL